MIRILHTADVQIDATLPELGKQAHRRRGDLLHTFEHLVALAIRENVHLFLVSGNLFATPRPEEAAVQRVSSALRRLTARGILPVLLPGDCDGMMSPDSVYLRETFRNLLVLDGRDPASPVTTRIAGRTVHLYGFCQRGEQPLPGENLRLDEDGCHIALMCFSSTLHMEPTFLERIASWEMDYFACAPTPQWQAIELGDRLFGCAPGSPEGYAFSHSGPRYVALAHVEGENLRLERREVNRRRVEIQTLELDAYATVQELEQAILEGARNDLLRRTVLTGTPRFAFNPERLQQVCAGAFYYFELRDMSRVLAGEVAQRMLQEGSSSGEFMRAAKKMTDELSPEEGRLVEEAVRAVLATQDLVEVDDETE
ncbi:MAG: hypothetical protein C0624_12175 [Desulfuromonas sp.]|nr:MAG: hypothetical protein C0624_12175 [Desulfuromonas sp.]